MIIMYVSVVNGVNTFQNIQIFEFCRSLTQRRSIIPNDLINFFFQKHRINLNRHKKLFRTLIAGMPLKKFTFYAVLLTKSDFPFFFYDNLMARREFNIHIDI